MFFSMRAANGIFIYLLGRKITSKHVSLLGPVAINGAVNGGGEVSATKKETVPRQIIQP
jgi:hypothetical protein